jgi:hypothetical protein
LQPLSTIHGGEYLAASYIEKHFKPINVWVPSRDTGIDMLATDHANKRMLTLQVKSSKDYLYTDTPSEFRKKLRACGWYKISRNKLMKSQAEYWVFVQWACKRQSADYIIVATDGLRQRLWDIYGKQGTEEIQFYLWVTESGKCWDTRRLKISDRRKIVNGEAVDSKYNFTSWLNTWHLVARLNNYRPRRNRR